MTLYQGVPGIPQQIIRKKKLLVLMQIMLIKPTGSSGCSTGC